MDVIENKLQVRNRAIGMLLAGSTQKSVANILGKDIGTVRRWWWTAISGPWWAISVLKIQLESAWSTLQPSFLQVLVDGIPERVKTCIELDGNYISK